MKSLILTLALILTTICSISQTGYPYKTVLDGDTVVVFHQSQIKTLNWVKDVKDYTTELSDSLAININRCNEALIESNYTIECQEVDLSLCDKENQLLTEHNGLLTTENTALKKQNKRLKKVTVGLICVEILQCIALAIK
jgi:hypothetical protein